MQTPQRHRRAMAATAAAALATLLLAGCGRSEAPEAAAPPPRVSVVALVPDDFSVADVLSGRVAPVRTAEIRPQVGGIVRRRLFEQGAEIRQGAALFQIDPAPFRADADMARAALQRAEAVAAQARLQAGRLEPLVQAQAVSRQAYDDAVSQRDQAMAEVAQARATLARRELDLRFATVTAPIAGRVDQALVTEGALVSPTDASPMARIQQIDQVYVDVRQPASALEALRSAVAEGTGPARAERAGLAVQILGTGDHGGQGGRPGSPGLEGRVLFSGISVDAGTGDVLVRILVDNHRRQLLPGMFVQARVPRATYPGALAVPQQAVVRTGGQASLWVVDDAQRAHAVPVALGELVQGRYRIAQGAQAGQRIVVEGIERLSEGLVVEARDVPAPGVAAGAASTSAAVAAASAPAMAASTAGR